MKVCVNCGEAKIHGRGLCGKCYEYQRKHGKPSPLETKRGGKRRGDYTGDTCKNCGEGGRLRLGLCDNCYHYARRNDGAMRPLDRAVLSTRRKHTQCKNCGSPKHKGHGLCGACLDYLRDHGVMRPPEGVRNPPHATPRVCARCKQNMTQYGKLCGTCSNYLYRTGKPRPRHLWAEHCTNCDVPLGDFRPRSGLCIQCRRYQYRYGKPRPSHLWGKGAHGWCDCGQPASNIISVKIHNHIDTIPVCETCYAEEMRQRAWYGDNTVQKEADLQCKR